MSQAAIKYSVATSEQIQQILKLSEGAVLKVINDEIELTEEEAQMLLQHGESFARAMQEEARHMIRKLIGA
ncbi:MAG: hypothetical protein KC877_00345 [Candidatus Kaiserbacteria bacterium]|nr:hypothetical protein [Candidatus Kaiserbacteria bacterium]MCB9816000.1 hypothetical protein [Candidatus Nomurabacteria bacterium]